MGVVNSSVLGFDFSPHPYEPLPPSFASGTAPFGALHRNHRGGGAGLPPHPQPIALPPDVHRCRVMEDPIQHRRGEHRVPEHFAPLAEGLD